MRVLEPPNSPSFCLCFRCNYQLILCHLSRLYQRFHCTLGAVLAVEKFIGIGGNSIWRIQRNANFGNLIWRMVENIFWRESFLT